MGGDRAERRRLVVVGGTGFFGRAAVDLLRSRGLAPLVAARGRSPRTDALAPDSTLRLDAEDTASLRTALRPGDIVLDAAGPFQARTATLVEAAVDIGCDVIDISDSIDHVLRVEAQQERFTPAGIRVLTSCSSVTTLAAALVRAIGVADPVRIRVYLSPATRATANAGTSGALAHSLGRPIRVFRGGRHAAAVGWRESRPFRMPPPIGRCRGYLMESVQAVTFPRIWPGLRETDFWVDSRIFGMNLVFAAAARLSPLRRLLDRARRGGGTAVARILGSTAGGMLVEAEGADGTVQSASVSARERSYLAAVAPATLAADDLARGRGPSPGLVPHDRHVDPERLIDFLRHIGIDVSCRRPEVS